MKKSNEVIDELELINVLKGSKDVVEIVESNDPHHYAGAVEKKIEEFAAAEFLLHSIQTIYNMLPVGNDFKELYMATLHFKKIK